MPGRKRKRQSLELQDSVLTSVFDSQGIWDDFGSPLSSVPDYLSNCSEAREEKRRKKTEQLPEPVEWALESVDEPPEPAEKALDPAAHVPEPVEEALEPLERMHPPDSFLPTLADFRTQPPFRRDLLYRNLLFSLLPRSPMSKNFWHRKSLTKTLLSSNLLSRSLMFNIILMSSSLSTKTSLSRNKLFKKTLSTKSLTKK